MKGTLEVLLCAWFVVCGTCLGATFLVKKNSLSVTSPKSIRGGYECAIADFGVPEHGGALVGTVVYLKSNRKACKSFSEFDISSEFRPGGLRTFVLVDRGDCYFALKTWHVQASGAAAVLIADDITEPLTNINLPDNGNYLKNITIPSALITKSLGALIKKALSDGEMVNLTLDFTEALPGSPVKYELWTSGIYQCGPNCDALIEFLKSFKAVAQMLEQKGYSQFTPHYTTWYCPPAFVRSRQCRSQCISHGRYCVPTPEMEELNRWYEGKDVMVGNLRQACVFQVAKESRQPWLWWDYVTESATRCPMEEKKYKKGCVDQVIQSLGIDMKKIDECIGDPEADMENPVLQAEQNAQNGKRWAGDTTLMTTLVINNTQYRGKLEKGAVLQAICSSLLQEIAGPEICSQTVM